MLAKQTDCIIANSYYEYKCAVDAGISKNKIKVVYNAVSLDGQEKIRTYKEMQ
ncbi:hypothetical protein N1Z77_00008630 [Klebsiella pneumoniae]